jgi:SAM-dependent methyltransferase
MAARFPQVTVHYQTADFTQPLNLPPLDGIVMANSLHFLRRKEKTLKQTKTYLRENGRFILVEYNTDRGNIWVPHPLSYPTWAALARRIGFQHTEQIGRYAGRFMGGMYSAVSW